MCFLLCLMWFKKIYLFLIYRPKGNNYCLVLIFLLQYKDIVKKRKRKMFFKINQKLDQNCKILYFK